MTTARRPCAAAAACGHPPRVRPWVDRDQQNRPERAVSGGGLRQRRRGAGGRDSSGCGVAPAQAIAALAGCGATAAALDRPGAATSSVPCSVASNTTVGPGFGWRLDMTSLTELRCGTLPSLDAGCDGHWARRAKTYRCRWTRPTSPDRFDGRDPSSAADRLFISTDAIDGPSAAEVQSSWRSETLTGSAR